MIRYSTFDCCLWLLVLCTNITGDEDWDHVTLGQVEPFELEGGDWNVYTERLDQYLVANGVADDAKKVAVFLTVIGGRAYTLLRNLLAPTKPVDKSYSELVKVMKDHLNPKPPVIAERIKFHRRNQRDGETVAQYLAELRKLTEQCDFKEHLNEALRDGLVCGLRSEAIQRKLLIEENLTLQRAYEIAHSMETANWQGSELQASTKTAVFAKDIQRVAPLKPGNAGPPCYRCRKTGHPPDKCYFKSQRCRAFGKRGHIAKMCKAKESEKGTLKQSSPRTRSFVSRRPEGRAGHSAGYVERDKPNETSEVLDGPDQDYQLFAVTSAPKTQLGKSDTLLRTYTGEKLQVLGQLQVKVEYGDQVQLLPLLVVAGSGPSLWGRN